MDIKSFSTQLELQIAGGLQSINDDLVSIGKNIALINDVIGRLHNYTCNYEFADESEEIMFFKDIKPRFVSRRIYYKKIFDLKLSHTSSKTKTKLRNKVSREAIKFYRSNREFCEYYATRMTHLDHYYFTRSQIASIDGKDVRFNTPYDDKLSYLLAYELLLEHLNSHTKTDHTPTKAFKLTWSDSKTDLIELVYALHSAKTFNNGNVDIKEIAITFEKIFNIELGNYYRTFQDIQIRKKNTVSFLDRLRGKLGEKINETSSHPPYN